MLTSPLHAILDYPENLGSIGRTFPHLAEVPGLVDSEPIPYAAIWVSQWAWDRVDHLTESPYYGVYGAHHALTWSSLPFRLLTVGYDEVPDISLYQLVVLASVGRLESRQLDALRRFVARGGGLLVAGLPRADSEESLRQLLGAQQQIEEKPAYRLRIEADAAHALTLRQDLVERSMLRWPYRPFLRPGLRAMGGARACASYLSLADERTATAGIWLEQPGAGRVVFFSDPLFEVIPAWMDRQRGNKDHSQGCGEGYRYGRLLGAFAAWAGGQDPPLTLQARDNVYANGRISRDGKLILILNCNYDRPARVRLWVRVPAEGKQPEVISRIPKFSYHFSDTGGQRRGVSIDGLIPPGGLEWVVLHART